LSEFFGFSFQKKFFSFVFSFLSPFFFLQLGKEFHLDCPRLFLFCFGHSICVFTRLFCFPLKIWREKWGGFAFFWRVLWRDGGFSPHLEGVSPHPLLYEKNTSILNLNFNQCCPQRWFRFLQLRNFENEISFCFSLSSCCSSQL